MLSFLYSLTIYPIKQIIEFFYVLFSVASKNQGISIIGVSLIFTLLCLPLYITAEKWQEIERETQNRMKKQIQRIKTAFKGDEQYMMISTYYRQQHYHPLMALRSSFGLLIQIPFFIAAYSFLAHLQQLQGSSFLFISDMGKADALFKIGKFTINVLPIAMTLINITSGLIYSRGHETREKIQIFVSAGIFLVLLYNMPAGLVLYWTMNNIFSTLKNICYKLPKMLMIRLLYSIAVVIYALSAIYLLFVHTGNFGNRMLLAVAGLIIPLSPILLKGAKLFFSYFCINDKKTCLELFLISCVLLCILTGFMLPSSVIYSSPAEFSNIDGYGSPLYFLFNTFSQAAGFCLFWPLALFFLFSNEKTTLRSNFTLIALFLSSGALINAFVFSGNYGNLSSSLVFDKGPETNIPFSLFNIFVLAIAVSLLCILVRLKKVKSMGGGGLTIFIFALSAISLLHTASIQKKYKLLEPVAELQSDEIEPIYSLSKTKRNIVVFFLDRFTSSFFPEIIKECPELSEIYSGFTYYPNTISYGLHTIVGSPAMLGGYDYRPEQTNAREIMQLIDKVNEGISTMPVLFSEMGFQTTFANPEDAELQQGFFKDNPKVKTVRTNGTYRKIWYSRHGSNMLPVKSTLIKRNFIWLSFFCCAPAIMRETIYKKSYWSSQTLQDTDNFVDSYSGLDFLPELTDSNAKNDTFTIIHNLLPHEPMYLDAPEYTLPKDIDDIKASNSAFGNMADYYSAAASIHLVAKWIAYLKQEGMYDNTRIVIASDHGVLIRTSVFKNNNVCQVEGCNPLLLFKDFDDKGELKIDNTFMTQCDVPFLCTHDLKENEQNNGLAIHPHTKKNIDMSEKQGEQHLFMNHNNTAMKNGKYTYTAKPNEWYSVHDDIFNPDNWKNGH